MKIFAMLTLLVAAAPCWGAETYTFSLQPASGNVSGPMTEEAKAERKTLIANNKTFHVAKLSTFVRQMCPLPTPGGVDCLARKN